MSENCKTTKWAKANKTKIGSEKRKSVTFNKLRAGIDYNVS